MKTFYIDFEGWCEIKAESRKEAEKIFWNLIHDGEELPHSHYEFISSEEKEE